MDLPKSLQSISSQENLDLGETSCACPSKMGEGRDGLSHCPLPKVLVRSEEESLKLNVSKNNQQTSIPQDLQIAYSRIIDILSNPLTSSSLELDLAKQLIETYKKHEAVGIEESYE